MKVTVIKALGDNYIYLYHLLKEQVLAIDPGNALGVLKILNEKDLKLSHILATHHHYDHTAGISELKKETGSCVIGADVQRIPQIDKVVEDGQIIELDSAHIKIISTPGHTRTSVCYLIRNKERQNALFTGDTLFVGGCGRILECDAKTMWDSLQKLAQLPDNTLVYTGHNYTAENYEFSLTIEPDNRKVKEKLEQVLNLDSKAKPTMPSTIQIERQTNIFLRAGEAKIKNLLRMAERENWKVFSELRKRKDRF